MSIKNLASCFRHALQDIQLVSTGYFVQRPKTLPRKKPQQLQLKKGGGTKRSGQQTKSVKGSQKKKTTFQPKGRSRTSVQEKATVRRMITTTPKFQKPRKEEKL